MNNVIDSTLQQVRARAARVNPAVQGHFAKLYAAWQATWSDSIVLLSSAPVARAQSAEFRELLALGQDILPLLMEKLTEPDECFALVAVDRLLPADLVVKHDMGDAAVLLGEQGRAIETIQRWLHSRGGGR